MTAGSRSPCPAPGGQHRRLHRYMGAEILGAGGATIEPDRVFHLMTDKDKHLPALDRYLEEERVPSTRHRWPLESGQELPQQGQRGVRTLEVGRVFPEAPSYIKYSI